MHLRTGLLCLFGPLLPLAAQHAPAEAPAGTPRAGSPRAAQPVEHGRIEHHGGLRVVHLWGTPGQRGRAHGELLGGDVARLLRAEFAARFGRRPELLAMARQMLPRLIDWPPAVRSEIEALYAAVVAGGADRRLEAPDRDFDLDDLLIANALDVFGLMGCSGFTVWGDQVAGGGVLTARNFDWPFTGPHMVDDLVVLVQHAPDGRAVASVTWPGYVAVVTGVNREGVAAFLHVGSAEVTFTPEPGSWPTAIALREVLGTPGTDAGTVFATALDRLGWTSPPAGYLVRIVLPAAPAGGSPLGLFESDSKKVVRAELAGPCVVTNHFQGRTDGRPASKDSLDRLARVRSGIAQCLEADDRRVSVGEAWEVLGAVQRGGHHGFGTLHSLVFRREPWCFELRIGELGERQGLVAAPASSRRFALDREVLFPAGRGR